MTKTMDINIGDIDNYISVDNENEDGDDDGVVVAAVVETKMIIISISMIILL